VLWLRRWASGGDEAPVSQVAIDRAVWKLQRASGATIAQFGDRGTNLDEAEQAYEAERFAGRTKPVMRKYHGGNVRTDLLPALRDGRVALCAVSYGVAQDAGMAVGTFRGGHAIVVGDPDRDTVGVVDPLRQQTVRWSIALLVKAMERFGKRPWLNGRGEFGVVTKSPTFLALARTQRDEARELLAQTEEVVAVSRRALDTTRTALKATLVQLEACRGIGTPTDPAAIAKARAQGIADAAAAAKGVV